MKRFVEDFHAYPQAHPRSPVSSPPISSIRFGDRDAPSAVGAGRDTRRNLSAPWEVLRKLDHAEQAHGGSPWLPELVRTASASDGGLDRARPSDDRSHAQLRASLGLGLPACARLRVGPASSSSSHPQIRTRIARPRYVGWNRECALMNASSIAIQATRRRPAPSRARRRIEDLVDMPPLLPSSVRRQRTAEQSQQGRGCGTGAVR